MVGALRAADWLDARGHGGVRYLVAPPQTGRVTDGDASVIDLYTREARAPHTSIGEVSPSVTSPINTGENEGAPPGGAGRKLRNDPPPDPTIDELREAARSAGDGADLLLDGNGRPFWWCEANGTLTVAVEYPRAPARRPRPERRHVLAVRPAVRPRYRIRLVQPVRRRRRVGRRRLRAPSEAPADRRPARPGCDAPSTRRARCRSRHHPRRATAAGDSLMPPAENRPPPPPKNSPPPGERPPLSLRIPPGSPSGLRSPAVAERLRASPAAPGGCARQRSPSGCAPRQRSPSGCARQRSPSGCAPRQRSPGGCAPRQRSPGGCARQRSPGGCARQRSPGGCARQRRRRRQESRQLGARGPPARRRTAPRAAIGPHFHAKRTFHRPANGLLS